MSIAFPFADRMAKRAATPCTRTRVCERPVDAESAAGAGEAAREKADALGTLPKYEAMLPAAGRMTLEALEPERLNRAKRVGAGWGTDEGSGTGLATGNATAARAQDGDGDVTDEKAPAATVPTDAGIGGPNTTKLETSKAQVAWIH